MKNLLSFCLWVSLLYGILLGTWSWSDNGQQIEKKPLVSSLLFLKGEPYEMGFQHGQQLKEAIAYNVKRWIDEQILAHQDHPQIKSFLAQLPQVLEHIPDHYIQELKGLADGAQLPYDKILLLNLFPEMFHCSGMTVKGQATKGREIYHVRVLDYSIGMNLQDTAVLMVVQPSGKIPFLNVSYAGFIGSVTGMNSQHISIGEIGGKGDGQYNGMPMAFLLRAILERARNLQDVKEFLASTPRTCEYYYLFSDGKSKESIGAYATSQQLQWMEPGSSYAIFDLTDMPENHFAKFSDNKMVLNSPQMENSPYQTLLYQDKQKQKLWGLIHHQPVDCLVMTGFSHPKRYPILIQRILDRYGHIGVQDLQEFVKGEGGAISNLHTAIFAPATLDVWIAHAGPKNEPAWSQPYQHFNLEDLLEGFFKPF